MRPVIDSGPFFRYLTAELITAINGFVVVGGMTVGERKRGIWWTTLDFNESKNLISAERVRIYSFVGKCLIFDVLWLDEVSIEFLLGLFIM